MLTNLFSFKTKKNQKLPPIIENHTLYYYATCPFCLRVLITMKSLGIELEKRNIHDNPQHLKDLIQGGGQRMVPCLRIEENNQTRWMYESGDIVAYLKKITPN